VLHREYQERAKHPAPRWLTALVPIFNVLLWPFGRWIRRTISNRFGRSGRLEQAGKFRDAYDLSMESAPLVLRPDGRVDEMGRWQWWVFVARAAR